MVSHRQEAFLARIVEMGLEDCIPALKTKGLTTMSKLAFGCDYNPQMADAGILTEQLLTPMTKVGDVQREDLVPPLRMLWWECWAIATQDMKRASDPEGGSLRKLSAPELAARRSDVLKKLPGLVSISGEVIDVPAELDVSDQLVTDCTGIYEGNRLRYVPWEACTARRLEVIGQKQETAWIKDSSGFMKCEDLQQQERQEHANSEYALDLLLKRRGLAMAMADLMSFEAHERLRKDYMSELVRIPPPGYSRMTLGQLRRADETAFMIMAKLAESGVKRKGGERPLDAIVDKVLTHRDYSLAMQPLPAGAKREYVAPAGGGGDDSFSKAQKKRLRKEAAVAKGGWGDGKGAWVQDYYKGCGKQDKGWGKGKGYGKQDKGYGNSKGKGKNPVIPNALRYPGVEAVDAEESPICFAWNMEGCQAAPPGGRCPKGRHICMLASCRGTHGYLGYHAVS